MGDYPWLQLLGFLAVPVVIKGIKVLKPWAMIRKRVQRG